VWLNEGITQEDLCMAFRVITLGQVAALAGVSYYAARLWTIRGVGGDLLPSVKVGGVLKMVRERDARRFIARHNLPRKYQKKCQDAVS
jgi:hypothetical protein